MPRKSSYAVVISSLVGVGILVALLAFWPFSPRPAEPLVPGEKTLVDLEPTARTQVTPTPQPRLVPSPTGQPSVLPAETRKPSLGEVRVRIVDALGDPVERGRIEVAGNRFAFESGVFDATRIPRGIYTLAVSAEGYASATQSISVPVEKEIVVTLEYVCSFEFGVYSREGREEPIEGAEVILWEGPRVRRPPAGAVTINFAGAAPGEPESVRMIREARGVRVTEAKSAGSFTGRRANAGYWKSILQTGDSILGLFGCMWLPGYDTRYLTGANESSTYLPPSARLRIWDTLTAQARSRCLISIENYADVERNGARLLCRAGRIVIPAQRGEIVATAATDSSGRCRIENLPAGTYYVQARHGNTRSWLKVLYPTQRGLDLVTRESNSIVHVNVSRSGVGRRDLATVVDARVVLKSLASTMRGGLFFGKTDRTGRASFEAVPWGDYTVTVSPPAGESLHPKTVRVVVDSPVHNFDIKLEGGTYQVSGRVLRADTKEPVEGFGLALYTVGETHRKYSETISGRAGDFTFTDVLPGDYEIRPSFQDKAADVTLLPVAWSTSPHGKPIFSLAISVDSQNVEGIEYLVQPAVTTLFTGLVTTADGSPAQGAQVTLRQTTAAIVDDEDKTGADGRFSLSVTMLPDNLLHTAELIATIEEGQEFQPTLVGPSSSLVVGGRKVAGGAAGMATMGPGRTTARGISPVEFRTGDTVSNIRIVLRSADEAPAVLVRVTTEDGNNPGPLHVYAFQNENFLTGNPQPDGSYRIDWIQPGPLVLHVEQMFLSGFGAEPQQGQAYCNEEMEIEMPPDQNVISVDITLAKATHLAGIVIDANRQPVPGAIVQARSEGAKTPSAGYSETDENGKFWISGLRPGVEYTIRVRMPDDAESRGQLDGLKPPQNNIIIVIEKSE